MRTAVVQKIRAGSQQSLCLVCAGRLTDRRDVGGITTEGMEVGTHPFESCHYIGRADGKIWSVVQRTMFVVQKTESAEPIAIQPMMAPAFCASLVPS